MMDEKKYKPCDLVIYGALGDLSRRKLMMSLYQLDKSKLLEPQTRIIGVDSLAFISLDGLYRALGKPGRDAAKPQFCDACFTGEYAIPLTDWTNNADRQLSLLQPAGQ